MKIQKINVTVAVHELKEKKKDIANIEIFIFLISRRLFHNENHGSLIFVLLHFQRHSFHFTKMNKKRDPKIPRDDSYPNHVVRSFLNKKFPFYFALSTTCQPFFSSLFHFAI